MQNKHIEDIARYIEKTQYYKRIELFSDDVISDFIGEIVSTDKARADERLQNFKRIIPANELANLDCCNRYTMAAIYKLWKRYKQCYRFNSTLIYELTSTKSVTINTDILESLPFSELYFDVRNLKIKLNLDNITIPVFGIFLSVYKDLNEQAYVLNYMLWAEDNSYATFTVYMRFHDNWEFDAESKLPVKTSDGYEERPEYGYTNKVTRMVWSMILYLVSEEPDIIYVKGEKKKTKREQSSINSYDVGFRIGNAIDHARKQYLKIVHDYESGITKAKVRPHVRAAHYHHYWVGPKGNQKRILKWIAVSFVNCDGSELLPIVDHLVKS